MIPERSFRVKIYADGASLGDMVAWHQSPLISGFTTNPTLMRKAGITDYAAFGRSVVAAIPDRPISFEVFSDDFNEMECQAHEIASWGPNVFVKIPITNTESKPSRELVRRLSLAGVKINVTAVLSVPQVEDALAALEGGAPANVSVFAGRIADTGRDPMPLMREALALARRMPAVEVIWASPRELLNLFQADEVGCHIITMTTDLLNKLPLIGRDLDAFSLDTVKMFRADAVKAGYTLKGLAQPT